MTRRLVLVGLPWHRDRDPRVPLGHASLLAAARARGVEVASGSFSLNVERFDIDEVVEFVLSSAGNDGKADLGVGAYIWNERILQRLIPEFRRQGFSGRIIVGGPQVSYAGAGLEEFYPGVDVFVRGYGEQVLPALAKSRLARPIPGVHYAGSDDLSLQASADLKSLPSPLLSGVVPVPPGAALVRMETQRGCPFRCSFCQHREAGRRLTQRELPLDRVLAEVDLVSDREVREVAILDPVFNMGSGHHEVLDRFIARGFGGKLSVQARLETADDSFIEQCKALRVIPEFGLQTIHRPEQIAVQRPNSMGRVDAVLAELRRSEVPFLVTVIYGLPEQTYASFRATVEYLLEARVPAIRAFPLVLLRGTELERRRAEWSLVEDRSPIPQVVASSTFGRADQARMASLAAALRETEWRHPASVADLERLAALVARSAA